MRLSRSFTATMMLSSATIAVIASCSDGSTVKKTVDAPPGTGDIDAPVVVLIDAPAAADEGLGKSCTPGAGGGINQGDCPTGFVCLSLQGGTHPWCSKTCTQGAGDTCGTGYTGNGHPLCYLGVGADTYCGVVCQDNTGNNQICSAAQCNGTCPSTPTLACTAELKTPQMVVVAHGCQ